MWFRPIALAAGPSEAALAADAAATQAGLGTLSKVIVTGTRSALLHLHLAQQGAYQSITLPDHPYPGSRIA